MSRTEPRPTSNRAVKVATLPLICGLAVALALLGGGTAAAKGGGHRALYWGAQIGDQLTGEQAPWDMNAVYKFERLVRKKMSVVSFQAPFATCRGSQCSFYTFPTEPMTQLREHGAIPLFSWSSSSVSEGTKDPRFRLANVINGTYDSYIREFAERAREWGHPFFLRFDWEMNGNWFPWGEGVNGNKPGEFVTAWRHVHDIFTEVGATNATWVWCPNVGRQFPQQYPGNSYVDWTCLDGYNWGTRFSWSHWQSFNKIFHHSYRTVRKIAPSKPMMLGEVASTPYGGSKPEWIKNMLREVREKYHAVHGLIWFDVEDRNTKWPVETPRSVRNAFAAGIANRAYRPNLFSAISSSPIPAPEL
ncbi:MAG TPA: glycosyl hydrolase [Solirubrobacterales bacterium]|nr:glycosyl hydrolase [Solirubrobacterales bacterium]